MSVVVDGVEIPESLLAEEIQHHPGSSVAEARKAAGKALAIRALLLHRADELGLAPQPIKDEQTGCEETDEEALIRAVLSAEVEIDPPDERACKQVYDTQRAHFTAPPLMEASHILIEPKAAGEEHWEAACVEAKALLNQLQIDPGLFGHLARTFSACPSGQIGGSLGQLGPGDVVGPVEEALAALAPGELATRPVRSRFGWHVLRLDRRIQGRPLPYEHVAERIRLHLESRAWTAAAVQYISRLAERTRQHGVAFSIRRDGRLASGSLALGDLLNSGAATDRLEIWLDAADPLFAKRVRDAADAAQQDFARFVRQAVAHFANHADDEAWTRLISAARDAEDPALAAITLVLKTKLSPPSRTLISRKRREA